MDELFDTIINVEKKTKKGRKKEISVHYQLNYKQVVYYYFFFVKKEKNWSRTLYNNV